MCMRNMTRWIRDTIAILASAAIVICPTQAFAVATFAGDSTLSSYDPADTPADLAGMSRISIEEIDNSVWELEGRAYDLAEEFDASRYSYNELLEALDFDPERAFHFVRDNIRLDPYIGVLRDSDGVIGGRAGNAYDRSLLLKRILEDMGYEARLAFGPLNAEHEDELRQAALAPLSDPDDILPLAQLAGFSVEMRTRMIERVKRDYRWLKTGLGDARSDSREADVVPEALRNHVWVQAKLDTNWEDLDSSFPHAVRGDIFASARRYSNDAANEDRHVVQLRIVAETLKDGRLGEEELLVHQLRASDAAVSRTYLAFVPRNATMGGVLTDALGPARQFVPALLINGDTFVGNQIPGIATEMSGSKEFLFGAQQRELTGLYLDIRVGPAGALGPVTRGVLIDRVPALSRLSGEVNRENLKILQMNENQPEDLTGLHQVLVSNGGSNPRTVSADVGLAYYFVGKHLTAPDALEELSLDATMWPAAMFRNAQLAFNERLLEATLNDRDNIRFFIGEPRVYIMGQVLRHETGGARIGLSIDLLHDPIHSVSAKDVHTPDLNNRRIWHGVVQSSFETTLVELPTMMSPDSVEYTLSASTESTGKSLRFSAPDDPRLPTKAPFALRRQLAEGKVIVASTTSLVSDIATWWAVSPNGTTRAMVAPSGGYGITMWEEFRNLKLPKGSLFQRTYTVNPEALDAYAEKARKARAAYRAQALSRTSNPAPKVGRSGGGTEYQIALNISLYSAIGATGILGLAIVAISIGGMLYMIGYVLITERQRRERGY